MNLPARLFIVGLSLFLSVAVLGLAVNAGWFHNFDFAVSHALNLQRGQSPDWLIRFMWCISWTGGGIQRYFIVTILALILWRWWGWGAGLAMGLGSLIANLTSETMKEFYARIRPDLVPQLDPISSHAYPSGHATSAAVVYILFIMLVPQARHPAWQVIAALMILLTGISRIMLGVHWPTDVIGGWMLGAAFALFAGAIIAWREQQRSSAFPSALTPEDGPHAKG